MRISVINLQKKIPIKESRIRRIVKQILLLQNRSEAELSLVFVNDSAIKKLNKTYLKKNHTTDVLSFDFKEKNQSKRLLNAEIIISLETALRNSNVFDVLLWDEIVLYLIHGILHLCGYDDRAVKDKQRMDKRQKYILSKIKK